MSKKNIAVIMAGYSSEKEISIQSGNLVVENLDTTLYRVFPVHILPEKWVVLLENKEFDIDKNDFSFSKNDEKINFDVVFNAIHGDPGENGKIIAYFEFINQKHTSAPFYQMALTFNKRDTLSILKKYNIAIANSIYINKGDVINLDAIVSKLGLPCFVKPNNAGSSYGISKVYKKEHLMDALEKAYAEDDEVLIESFLDGKEVSVGAYNYNNTLNILPMTEIISENDFFDYEAKYLGQSNEITPADLSEKEAKTLTEITTKIQRLLGMKGLSRTDFIIVDGKPHFIELNSVPGMSPESIVPQQIIASGMTLKAFFTKAIQSVL